MPRKAPPWPSKSLWFPNMMPKAKPAMPPVKAVPVKAPPKWPPVVPHRYGVKPETNWWNGGPPPKMRPVPPPGFNQQPLCDFWVRVMMAPLDTFAGQTEDTHIMRAYDPTCTPMSMAMMGEYKQLLLSESPFGPMNLGMRRAASKTSGGQPNEDMVTDQDACQHHLVWMMHMMLRTMPYAHQEAKAIRLLECRPFNLRQATMKLAIFINLVNDAAQEALVPLALEFDSNAEGSKMTLVLIALEGGDSSSDDGSALSQAHVIMSPVSDQSNDNDDAAASSHANAGALQ
jgi:hypothetical protein